VVFFSPTDGTRLVKRVIGLPGDTVELRNDQLVINGQSVDYTTLEPKIPEQLSNPERAHSIFATEQLPTHSHAVMAINGIPAIRKDEAQIDGINKKGLLVGLPETRDQAR
jgi:signal peptidase I